MKMKSKAWILHWLLGIAIVTSIALMYIVITNPFYTSRSIVKKSTSTTTSLTAVGNRVTLSNVVWPTSIVENTSSGQYLATSIKVAPVTQAKALIQSWKLKKVSYRTYSKKAYEKLLKASHYLVFNYADTVPLATAESLFKNQLKVNAKASINRVMVATDGSARVYMLEDKTRRVYSFTVTNAKNAKTLSQTFNKKANAITKNAVYYYKLHTYYRVGYSKSIKLSKYSYLISNDKISTYLSRILGSSITTINSKDSSTKTILYSDGSNQRISYNSKTKVLTYTHYSKLKAKNRQISLLQNSFTLLSKANVNLDDVRYFDYNSKTHTVVYRTYIGEWPVIGDGTSKTIGTYTYSVNGSVRRMQFTLRTLSVPVPTTSKKVTLPATKTVLARLQKAGYKRSSIQGLRIGYTVSNNKSSKQVVDMTPTYYVKINNRWRTYTSLLAARR